jgi:hypothetical protein
MFFECFQTLREVQVVTRPNVFATTGVLADVQMVQLGAGRSEVDVFDAYHRAKRHARVRGPHHAFASLTQARELPAFFQKFGLPSFEGKRELGVGEILIEAKRLRLLMEAWQANHAGNKSALRERLGELGFACRWDAHWVYWPPKLEPRNSDDQRAVDSWQGFMEHERECAVQRTNSYPDRVALHGALMMATGRVCEDALASVELTPALEISTDRPTLRWRLRPVELLGIEDIGPVIVSHERPHIGVPYGLMFLLDLSEGHETRVCADRFCGNVFAAGHRSQMFCSASCARRTAQRKYRQRLRINASRGSAAPVEGVIPRPMARHARKGGRS